MKLKCENPGWEIHYQNDLCSASSLLGANFVLFAGSSYNLVLAGGAKKF